MATSLADVEHGSQPRTRARAETGLVRSRHRLTSAHEELALAIEIFRELADRRELGNSAVVERLPALEATVHVLESVRRTLDQAIQAP